MEHTSYNPSLYNFRLCRQLENVLLYRLGAIVGERFFGVGNDEACIVRHILHAVDELLQRARIGAIVKVDNRPVFHLDRLLELVARAAHVPGALGRAANRLVAVLHIGRFQHATLERHHL